MVIDGGFQSHGETPKSSSVLYIDGFSTINHPAIGVPPVMLVGL